MMQLARQLVQKALCSCGYHLERIDQPPQWCRAKLERLILEDQLRRAGNAFFFVQVGACDVSFDNLYDFVTKHDLRGIVIEPIRDFYKELCAKYSPYTGVTVLNIAIHRTAKEAQMYRASPAATSLPVWTKGIASLDPDHHKKCNDLAQRLNQPGITSEHIITETVSCTSWDDLIKQHRVTHIDYLQIDTEGYDYEILQMLDFRRLRPAVIKFEHYSPAGFMTPKQLAASISRLIEEEYHVITMEYDAIAYSRLDIPPYHKFEISEQAGDRLEGVTNGSILR